MIRQFLVPAAFLLLAGTAHSQCASVAPKNYANVQGVHCTAFTSTMVVCPLTFPVTVGDTIAVAGLVSNPAGRTTHLSDNKSDVYTQIDSGAQASGAEGLTTYALVATTNGPSILTLTLTSGSATTLELWIEEFSGPAALDASAHSINPQVFGSTPAADAITSGSITTTSTNELIWGFALNSVGVNLTPGTGFASGYSTFTTKVSEWRTASGPTSTAATFDSTDSTPSTLAAAVAFK